MEKNLKIYENDTVASSTRRLVSLLIDSAIITLVSFVLIICYMFIAPQIPSYSEAEKSIKEEMLTCYKIEEEARVYEFEGEGDDKYQHPRQLEDIFADYAMKQILLSYSVDPVPFQNYNLTVTNDKNLPLASYETDNLAYFYVTYVPKYNNYNGTNNDIIEMDKDSKLMFMSKYKETAVKSDMWIFDEINYSYPRLNSSFAADLYKYLFVDDNYETGLTCYNYLAKNYQNLWNLEVDELLASSRFSSHYQNYKSNYATCSYIIDAGVVSCYILTYFTMIVVPQFFFKNGKSFGKKLMKVSVVGADGYPLQTYQIVLRNIINGIGYFPFMIFTCFLSGGTSSGWVYPLFEIGNYGFSLLSLMTVIGLVSFVSFLIMCFRSKKQTFHDMILRTICIDDRYHISQEEAFKMKKEEEEKLTYNDVKINTEVLDSSTFLNKKDDE